MLTLLFVKSDIITIFEKYNHILNIRCDYSRLLYISNVHVLAAGTQFLFSITYNQNVLSLSLSHCCHKMVSLSVCASLKLHYFYFCDSNIYFFLSKYPTHIPNSQFIKNIHSYFFLTFYNLFIKERQFCVAYLMNVS